MHRAPPHAARPAGYWLQMLGAALPSASTYFLNYIIIHALCTNFFRFIWCAGLRCTACAVLLEARVPLRLPSLPRLTGQAPGVRLWAHADDAGPTRAPCCL